MTEFTGSILELNKKQALVMTDSCDFVYIQRQPEMIVGQQIRFTKAEINRTNKNYVKYFALIASIFIIALSSIFYFQIFVPSTVFAYIDIDINPSLEFVIDKNAKVLDIKPLNNDAQTLVKDLKLVDLPIELAISEVVKTSEQLGFISSSKSNAILISASINTAKNNKQNITNQKVLDNILSSIGNETFDVGTENIKPEILKVTPENRKSALKNDISMGRYVLYSKIKKDNNDITVEKAKTERVSDMLDEAKNKNSNKNKIDSDSKDSKTDKKNSDNNQNDKSSDNNNSSSNNSNSKNDKEAGNFQKNENTTKKDKNITKSKNSDKNNNIKEDLEKKNSVQPKSNSTDKKNLINEKDKNDKKSNNSIVKNDKKSNDNTIEKNKEEENEKNNKNDKNNVKDTNNKQDNSDKTDKK